MDLLYGAPGLFSLVLAAGEGCARLYPLTDRGGTRFSGGNGSTAAGGLAANIASFSSRRTGREQQPLCSFDMDN